MFVLRQQCLWYLIHQLPGTKMFPLWIFFVNSNKMCVLKDPEASLFQRRYPNIGGFVMTENIGIDAKSGNFLKSLKYITILN